MLMNIIFPCPTMFTKCYAFSTGLLKVSLIDLTPFSTVFQLYCSGQCTYLCFPGILLTSKQHNILSKPLAAFPHLRTLGMCGKWLTLRLVSLNFTAFSLEKNPRKTDDLRFSISDQGQVPIYFCRISLVMYLVYYNYSNAGPEYQARLTFYHTIPTFNALAKDSI